MSSKEAASYRADAYTRALKRHVNLDAEASILGAIFLRNEVLLMLPDLEVEDFYSPKHGVIFGAIRNLEAMKSPIDPITVEAELQRVEKLEAVGGLGFLSELTLRVPSPENAIHYAGIVKSNRIARDVVRTAALIVSDMAEGGDDPINGEDAINMGMEHLQRIRIATTNRGKTMGAIVSEQYHRFYADLRRIESGQVVRPGSPTGIPILDENIGGAPYDVLTVVAARPANGKTTFAMQLTNSAVTIGKDDSLYFSFEDGESSFGARRIAQASGVSTTDFLTRNIDGPKLTAITAAYQKLQTSPDVLVMAGGMFVEDVVRYVKSFRRRPSGKLGSSRTRARLVVVDYLQKMRLNPEFAGRRHEAIGHITRTLSWLAQEEGISVVALSQLGRDVDKRPDPAPLVSDLKDSGDIEQDAKLIIGLLYRHNYDKNHRPDELEAHILKNNNGPQNKVINLHWDLATHTLCEHPLDLPSTRTRSSWGGYDGRFDGAPLPEEPHR